MRKMEDIKAIFVVPYVHADHAWTNSRQWHIKRYVEGMHRVLNYMKENDEFTFLIDNPLHYYNVLERFMPERMEELKQRIAEGRVCIANGGMSLARVFNYGDELYLRNAVGGNRFFHERFPMADLFMFFNADTAVGHSQMPQLLRKMGHTHYRFCRPIFALEQSGVPREFLWKGLDGTEIVASRALYSGFIVADYCDDAKCPTWEEKRAAFIKEEMEYRLPQKVSDYAMLFMGGDDTFPMYDFVDAYVDVEKFIAQWNEREKTKIQYGTPAQFHAALTGEKLPVWEGVIDPADLSYNGPGFRSADSLSRRRFAAEDLLLCAERLEVLLLELGGKPDAGLIKELWEYVFSFAGHAMQFLLADDYDELLERSDIVLGKVKQYIRELLLRIAHEAGSAEADSYLLINPDLFEREETVQFPVTTPWHVFGLQVLDETGAEIPYQIVDSYDGDKPYVNKDFNEAEIAITVRIPALGFRRIHITRGTESMVSKAEREVFSVSDYIAASEPIVFDNGRFVFSFVNGCVQSVVDAKTGTVRVSADDSFGQLRYYQTTPEIEWTYTWERDAMQTFQAQKVRWVQRGPECWRLTVFGTLNGLPAEVTVSTKRNSPTLKYEILVENREEEGYFSLAFPCSTSNGIVAGIPYGAEKRELEGMFYSEDHGIPMSDYLYFERGCKGSYCANRYTHFVSGTSRILLTQGDCSYHYRYNGDDGEIETFLLRSMDHQRREHLWLRHMHGTQERAGLHRFIFTASVLDENVEQSSVERLVSGIRFPIRVTPQYESAPKDAALVNSAAASLPENLTATAFYAEDGHLTLRLFENCGKGWEGTLPLIPNLKRAESCDLIESECIALPVENGRVSFCVKPWEIVTLHLWK